MASNIWQNLLRPPKSIAEYDREAQDQQQNALALQLNRQKIAAGQMAAEDEQRARADQQALRAALSGVQPGGGVKDRIAAYEGTRLPGGFAAADALRKFEAEQEKAAAAAGKDRTQTQGYALDQKIKATEFHIQSLGPVQDPQGAAQWLADGVKSGVFTDEQFQRGMQAVQGLKNPQELAQWKNQALAGGSSATEQLKAQFEAAKAAEQTRQFGVTSAETGRHNRASEGISAGNLGVAQANLGLSRERLAHDKAKPATQRATGPMSVTLQKELIEADDAVQSAASIGKTLDEAMKINDKAYSGYGAKARAVLTSNLGGTDSANATVDLDNMMTGQALESLKLVFGGMPTEGERKILLDMQASVDKTPTQRKAILDRANAAVKIRAKNAAAKARAIRDGTYLTEGVPADAAPAAPTEPAGGLSPAEKAELERLRKQFGKGK